MKPNLHLSDDLDLPLDAVTRAFGVFGQRGTGKSTTVAVIVEQACKNGGRAVVLDPTGVWYGLTREGTGPGIAGVVLGGEHADVALEAKAGALVAEFVIGTDYPLVVLDMKLLRKHERQHFAREFLEALYHDNRDPLLVVFDEAAQFAPQQAREGGEVPLLLGAVEDLVKLGRSRGLGAVMIEQRIATLNANVREQIETLVAHRLVGPLDRKALREWIAAQGEPEREAEALALIPKLQAGHALVWSPSFLKFFGQIAVHNATTFDSRATPEVGKRRRALTARAPVNLEALRSRMAETIERAKADDPKELRKQLAAKDAEIAKLKKAAESAKPTVERVEVPLLSKEDREALAEVSYRLEGVLARSRAVVIPPPPWETKAAPRVAPAQAADVRSTHAKRTAPPKGDASLSGGERKLLTALAQYEPNARTVTQVAVLTGYANGGSTLRNILGAMRSRGFVVGGREALTITGVGLNALGEYKPMPAGDALLQHWYAQLDRAQRAVLEVVAAAHPGAVTKEQIAEATGYELDGSTMRNALGRLRTLELISGRGELTASESLFG